MQLPRVLHLPFRGPGPQDCRCGHSARAHEHYRRGTDCALCSCPRFKAAPSRGRRARGSGGEQAFYAA